jgi:16S rRNA (cytosine967-C5)-methyltransferase
MPISIARKIAFETLQSVESAGAYATDTLNALFRPATRHDDAALATQLTLGTLRWQRLLDFLLARASDRPLVRLDAEVLVALRMGLYQMRFLDRVPARAAIHESVELVKAARKRSAAPLVNAVLRRAAALARQDVTPLLPQDASEAERLGIARSHPTWLVERWLAQRGRAETIALLESNNAPSAMCAMPNGISPEELRKALSDEGFQTSPGRLLREALRIDSGSLAGTKIFREGHMAIHDEASQAVPLLLDVRPGDRVLDLCAAPGGKTAVMARAAGLNGSVIACDVCAHRIRTMQAEMTRLQLSNIACVALDGTQPIPFPRLFSRILVDTPCSGTGTLGRNPEIRWRLLSSDIAELAARQSALLRVACAALEPGGRLVYATCSLEPEENEDVVRRVLEEDDSMRLVARDETRGRLAPFLAEDVRAEAVIGEDGYFRTSRPANGTDGFFAAVMEKTA